MNKENKSKICFVSDHLFGGGSERVLTLLANEFQKNGYCVTIIAFHSEERYPISDAIKIISLQKPDNILYSILELRKLFRQLRPSVIISFEYATNIFVSLANVYLKSKLIVSERNDPNRVGNVIPKKQLRNFAYRYLTDRIVFQTQDAKDFFSEGIGKKAIVILNPLKPNLPVPYEGKRRNVVINFCRLHKQKNLPLLIDSFLEFQKDYSSYQLHIYGDGKEYEYLKDYIKQQNCDKIVMLKPNEANVHNAVRDCAMFVSTSDYEGLSNSMLEAMAIGLPVVCTDCPCGGARMVDRKSVV